MSLDFNLKHLEYFIAAAKLGSINKAAQSLYISQPYLGKIIKDMEHEVGAVLFQRTRGGVTLTPDGEDFIVHANVIMKEVERMRHTLGEAVSSQSSLTVSMTKYSHIMECFIEMVVRHEKDPAFLHHLSEGTPEEVIEDVLSGRAGVGVFHFDSCRQKEIRTRMVSQALDYHFLCNVKPHIIISAHHPLIRSGQPVNLTTLAPYGFARYLGQCEDFTYRIFSQNAQYNLNYGSRIVYLTGRASLMHLISNSDFYSIGIHDFSAQTPTYQVLSIPIEDCEDMLEFGYIIQDGTQIPPITSEFIDGLTKRLKEGN